MIQLRKGLKPNNRNEVWLCIDGEHPSMGVLWHDVTWSYGTAWGRDRRRLEDQVDYSIKGEYLTYKIIDTMEIGYERCKDVAIRHFKGEFVVYRLD